MLTEVGVDDDRAVAGVPLGRALVRRAGRASRSPAGAATVREAAKQSRRLRVPVVGAARAPPRLAERRGRAPGSRWSCTRTATDGSIAGRACRSRGRAAGASDPRAGSRRRSWPRSPRPAAAAGVDQRRGAAHLHRRRGRPGRAAAAVTGPRRVRRRYGAGLRVHGRHPAARAARAYRGDPHPARNHRDPGVHRRRDQGDGQGRAAGAMADARGAGGAGQRLPPVPAAGRGHRRGGRRARSVHELARSDLHRQRRLPGDESRGRASRRCWRWTPTASATTT